MTKEENKEQRIAKEIARHLKKEKAKQIIPKDIIHLNSGTAYRLRKIFEDEKRFNVQKKEKKRSKRIKQ